MAEPTNPHVFMDISIDGVPKGRLVFELYDDVVPKTCRNFRCLCTGEKGDGLTYLGSTFHRIIPSFVCQGGDITMGNGTGGKSIYGTKFADESFAGKAGKHTGFGCLSMANAGPNTNSSQYFVCLGKTDWLNGKHIVFGNLVSGAEVLTAMEKCGTPGGRPTKKVTVTAAGQL